MDKVDNPELCQSCGKPVDTFVDDTIASLHTAMCDFLSFGSPADLLLEVSEHLRDHFEQDDEETTVADTNLTAN